MEEDSCDTFHSIEPGEAADNQFVGVGLDECGKRADGDCEVQATHRDLKLLVAEKGSNRSFSMQARLGGEDHAGVTAPPMHSLVNEGTSGAVAESFFHCCSTRCLQVRIRQGVHLMWERCPHMETGQFTNVSGLDGHGESHIGQALLLLALPEREEVGGRSRPAWHACRGCSATLTHPCRDGC